MKFVAKVLILLLLGFYLTPYSITDAEKASAKKKSPANVPQHEKEGLDRVISASPALAEAPTHVGNGPYRIETWEHNHKLTLVKNPTYWDQKAVKLDKLDFSMVENENTELAMFDNGELDWAGGPLNFLPTDALPVLNEMGILHTQSIAGVYWYKFNTEQKPFNNVKIRKAFAYAINRQELVDTVLQTGQLPAMSVIPMTMPLKKEGYFKDGDAETAKKLLAEGMKELGITKLPPITVAYNTSRGHQMIAEAVKGQWKEALGAEVKLESKEWKVHLEDMHNGQYQIARMGWLSDFNDPINYLELYKEKHGDNNDTNWENVQYKALLDQSAKEKDPEKRKQLLAQAEAILMEEMPVLPIYSYAEQWVQDEKVKSVVIDGLGYVDFKWATKESE